MALIRFNNTRSDYILFMIEITQREVTQKENIENALVERYPLYIARWLVERYPLYIAFMGLNILSICFIIDDI